MTVQFPLPAETANLTDREVEILRLLAAGHTVKSIAAHLGRTEASINERLREARRKTGVGSSRELARLLDTQKIWDKNIDLPPPRSLANDTPQPRVGRTWPKGTIAMLLTLPAAAIGLMLAANTPVQQQPQQRALTAAPQAAPLVGNWSLEVDRLPAEERPRAVTITFRVAADQKWTTLVQITGADGAVRTAESTAALDGVAVPVSGNMDFIDTVSLRQPAPNTLVMTLGKGGTPISTRVYAVAKDQKSMTETIIWAGTAMPKLETTHFKRIG